MRADLLIFELKPSERVMFLAAELLNLHRGQGMDLFWRENLICPTEPEYIEMVNNSALPLDNEMNQTRAHFHCAQRLGAFSE